jgi:hypothetical protein
LILGARQGAHKMVFMNNPDAVFNGSIDLKLALPELHAQIKHIVREVMTINDAGHGCN